MSLRPADIPSRYSRPKTLSDVTAQSHTTATLARALQSANLPHMLFYGPPGTGKTSTILALAKQLFGPELYRTRVLELNASDERGIGIVRTKIKDFARAQLSNAPAAGGAYRARHPCPPFKIVVLDEADSMTQDAQSALRRTMETYSRITRFCLVCNYVSRVIDPLASRCSKFRFKSLALEDARGRLEHIAREEGVPLAEGAVEELVKCSEGDLRRAITFLQSAARLVGAMQAAGGDGKKGDGGGSDDDVDMETVSAVTLVPPAVTAATVTELAGVIPPPLLARLFAALSSPKSTYAAIATVVTDIVAEGWSAAQLLAQLYERVVGDEEVGDLRKCRIVGVLGEVDKKLVDGADEHLVVLDMALRVSECLRG